MPCAYFAAPSMAYQKQLLRAYFVEPSTHVKRVALSIFRLPSMHVENGWSFIFRCAEHMVIKNGCSVRTSMHRACISKTILLHAYFAAPSMLIKNPNAVCIPRGTSMYIKRLLSAYFHSLSMYAY